MSSPTPNKAKAKATEFRDTLMAEDETTKGVDYFARREDGCRAILEARSGPWHLPMVCGETQTTDAYGCRSSYCKRHLLIYTNQPRRA